MTFKRFLFIVKTIVKAINRKKNKKPPQHIKDCSLKTMGNPYATLYFEDNKE